MISALLGLAALGLAAWALVDILREGTLTSTALALLGIAAVGASLLIARAAPEKSLRRDVAQSLLITGLVALIGFGVTELRRSDAEREQLRSTIGLQQDLTGIDLADRHLEGLYLAGKNFTGADLEGAQLQGAVLQGSTFAGADLRGADLDDADLQDAHLQAADLTGANLAAANLETALLDDANLSDSDLEQANLVGTQLNGACLAAARLDDAQLAGAHLHGAVLTQASVAGTSFTLDLRDAFLKGGRMQRDRASVPDRVRVGPYVQAAALADLSGADQANWPRGYSPGQIEARLTIFPQRPPGLPTDRVRAVEDGDTVRLARLRAVRIIGIDAATVEPGPAEGQAQQAARFLAQKLPKGAEVAYEPVNFQRDEFGRALVHLWRGNHLVSVEAARLGLVQRRPLSEEEGGPDSGTYDLAILQAEELAKQAGRGIWSSCPAVQG
jgi:uncharacterized protein YjbI with pentapeptide repeats